MIYQHFTEPKYLHLQKDVFALKTDKDYILQNIIKITPPVHGVITQ
jgi:hypothetical protein